MNTKLFIKSFFAVLASALMFAACTEEISITSFELNKAELTMGLGETQQLIGVIEPASVTSKITWTSSDEEIATVSETGLVTAVAFGKATITATVENKTATCNVEVISAEAEGITLNKVELELGMGNTERLVATVSPEGVDTTAMVWLSADDDIATISTNGEVTGVALGETEVYAVLGELKATCKVTVVPSTVESLTLNMTTAEMTKEETLQLVATTNPENTGNDITWYTSKYHIASVDENGLVTALLPGEVDITAKCGGKEATCTITVNPILAESILFDVHEISIDKGKTYQIIPTVTPSNFDGDIEWTTTDETVAIVNAEGLISAVSSGTATITATINGHSDECVVTVNAQEMNVGDFYYSDGTYSSELDPSKTPIGIIFWLGDATQYDPTLKREHPDCTNGLVIALDETDTCWWSGIEGWMSSTGGAVIDNWIKGMTGDYVTIKQTGDGNPMANIQGYNNTKALEFFNEKNPAYPVEIAKLAQEYRETVPAPENTSDWYVPSPKENSLFTTGEWDGENLMDFSIMMKVDMRDLINSKLQEIEGAAQLDPNRNYWSSAMSNSPSACYTDMTFAWMTLTSTEKTSGTDGHPMAIRYILAF